MTGTAVIDPDQLLRPILDLLATFGTGVPAAIDPAAVLHRSAGLVDAAVASGAGGLAAVTHAWSGEAATRAERNGTRAGQAGQEVVQRGKDLGAVVRTAAGIVARGNAELVAIAESFASTAAATAPVALTPPGQAVLVATAADHLGRALAVVTRTRAELELQTAQLDVLATPIPLPAAPRVDDVLGVARQLVEQVEKPVGAGVAELLGSPPTGPTRPADAGVGHPPGREPATDLGRPIETGPAGTTAAAAAGSGAAAGDPRLRLRDGSPAPTSGPVGAGPSSGSPPVAALAGAPLSAGPSGRSTTTPPAPPARGGTASGATGAGAGMLSPAIGAGRGDDERRPTPAVLDRAMESSALIGELGQVVVPVIGAAPADHIDPEYR